jgi:hypothetical protein
VPILSANIFTRGRSMSEVDNNKQLARELVEAMNRADTQWFLDNYAVEPDGYQAINYQE